MHVGPFGDEIGMHLRLYRLVAPKINGVCAELYHPFNDVAIGFHITEDVTQRIVSVGVFRPPMSKFVFVRLARMVCSEDTGVYTGLSGMSLRPV